MNLERKNVVRSAAYDGSFTCRATTTPCYGAVEHCVRAIERERLEPETCESELPLE